VVWVVFNAFLCVGREQAGPRRGHLPEGDLGHGQGPWTTRECQLSSSSPSVTCQPHDDRIANAWLASRCKFWKKNLGGFRPVSTFSQPINRDCGVRQRGEHATALFYFQHSCRAVPFIDVTHHAKNKWVFAVDLQGGVVRPVLGVRPNGSLCRPVEHTFVDGGEGETTIFPELIAGKKFHPWKGCDHDVHLA
jgi:hypothetical protein